MTRALCPFLLVSVLALVDQAYQPQRAEAALLSATVTYVEIGGPDDETGGNPASPVGDVITINNDSTIGQLVSVQITLGAALLFDTDVPIDTAGTDPAFPFTSSTVDPLLVSGANVLDGATSMTLTFNNFGGGDVYTLSIDVDQTGQINDNQNRQVLGSEFTGTAVFTFTGPFPGSPLVLTGNFSGSGQTASASVSTEVVPEPGTLLLAMTGVVIVAGFGGRRVTRRRRLAMA